MYLSLANSSLVHLSSSLMSLLVVSLFLVIFDATSFLHFKPLGLDAFNAFNVVDSLVNLARNYKRTVIFTIHQPRSNIVSLFDQLLVLAAGKMVYSGDLSRCHDYFEKIGRPCPPGFNIADYLSTSNNPSSMSVCLSSDSRSYHVHSNIFAER